MAGSPVTGAAALFAAGLGTGLLAGATSCAAVQLGLLTGAVRDTTRAVPSITAFLGAKLALHSVLGALLGLLGATVTPGPRTRAALLVAASALLALYALDMLGLQPVHRLLRRESTPEHCKPVPSLLGRARRGEADSRAGTEPRARGGLRGPVLLGAATVLVPCGLTLSAELLAVTSGSALGGASVMAGFVLGTAPVFALLGLALGRGLAMLRGRLTALVGIGLLAVAAWTALSGLRVGGWLPDRGDADGSVSAQFVRIDTAGVQVITVWAVDRGYRPASLTARAGTPTVLVVRTEGNHGCTRAFVIPARGLDRMLPVTGETRIDLGSPGTGRLRYTCATGHYPGSITFRR